MLLPASQANRSCWAWIQEKLLGPALAGGPCYGRPRDFTGGVLLLWALLGTLSSSCGKGPLPPKKATPGSGLQKLSLHRFNQSPPPGEGFSLWQDPQLSLEAALAAYLQSQGLAQGYELRPRRLPQQKQAPPPPGATSFDLYWGQTLVCEAYARAHRLKDGTPMFAGELPLQAPPPPARLGAGEGWGAKEAAFARARAALDPAQDGSIELHGATPCWLWWQEDWQRVWQLELAHGSFTYEALADDLQALLVRPKFFTVTGALTAYRDNPLTGTLGEEQVELTGTGYLDNAIFTTKPYQRQRAYFPDHQFIVPAEDPQLVEIATFAYVNRMYQWLIDMGYQWQGGPLTIKSHELIAPPGGAPSANNAFFQPASGGNDPFILVGDGDGSVLQNLGLDADVVSHELGHHVVFSVVTSTQQEEEEGADPALADHSGAIHEGLADYFTFARTNNSCLGESICPADSGACYLPEQCLRTADNTLAYGSSDYWSMGAVFHLKGQLVSGLLWDVRRELTGSAIGNFDRMVMASVKFLNPKSTYHDLLLALLTADYESAEQEFACKLVAASKGRGFEAIMATITSDCTTFKPLNADSPSEEGSQGDPSTPRGSYWKKRQCGTIAASLPSGPFSGFPWQVLLLPLLVALQGLCRRGKP